MKAISPWIYGSNSTNITNRTFDRSGGNRMTGYNWENNASNAGSDWYHHSDYGLANNQSNATAGYGRSRHDPGRRHRLAAPSLVTVPMAGYVAADGNGTVDETEVAPSPRWKKVDAEEVDDLSWRVALDSLPTRPTATSSPTSSSIGPRTSSKTDQPALVQPRQRTGPVGRRRCPPGWQSGDEPRPWENPPSQACRPAPAAARIR